MRHVLRIVVGIATLALAALLVYEVGLLAVAIIEPTFFATSAEMSPREGTDVVTTWAVGALTAVVLISYGVGDAVLGRRR